MRNSTKISDDIIRGKCSLFVCHCCRTKYGWEHQKWCDLISVNMPSCEECRYYCQRDENCTHPSKKPRKGEMPYEED